MIEVLNSKGVIFTYYVEIDALRYEYSLQTYFLKSKYFSTQIRII